MDIHYCSSILTRKIPTGHVIAHVTKTTIASSSWNRSERRTLDATAAAAITKSPPAARVPARICAGSTNCSPSWTTRNCRGRCSEYRTGRGSIRTSCRTIGGPRWRGSEAWRIQTIMERRPRSSKRTRGKSTMVWWRSSSPTCRSAPSHRFVSNRIRTLSLDYNYHNNIIIYSYVPEHSQI